MHPQTSLIEEIQKKANGNNLFAPVIYGKLKNIDSIAMQVQAGFSQTTYYGKKELRVITILFLSKHKSSQIAHDALCVLSDSLIKQPHISGNGFEWIKTDLSTSPVLVDIQENGQHIYSCVVNISAYL